MNGAQRPPRGPSRDDGRLDAALDEDRDALKALFPLPSPAPRRKRSAGKAAKRVAGTAVALALAAGGLAWMDPAYRSEHYASGVGERREVALADGSRLTLDTATALDVSWHLRSRRVVLHQGQVRFQVDPAVYRPFEVRADDTRVRVVGTVFDVRRDPGRVTVTVAEGRVRVSRGGGEGSGAGFAFLGAGEQVAYGADAPGESRQVDPALTSAWTDGRLVFERTPLADALREIQRYRQGQIRLHGERIAVLELSGVFETADAERMLDLLPRILPVAVTRGPDGSVDVRAR